MKPTDEMVRVMLRELGWRDLPHLNLMVREALEATLAAAPQAQQPRSSEPDLDAPPQENDP